MKTWCFSTRSTRTPSPPFVRIDPGNQWLARELSSSSLAELPTRVTVRRMQENVFYVDSYFTHLGTIEIEYNGSKASQTFRLKDKTGNVIATAAVDYHLNDKGKEIILLSADIVDSAGKHACSLAQLTKCFLDCKFFYVPGKYSIFNFPSSYSFETEPGFLDTPLTLHASSHCHIWHLDTGVVEGEDDDFGVIERTSLSSFFSIHWQYSWSLHYDKKKMVHFGPNPIWFIMLTAIHLPIAY